MTFEKALSTFLARPVEIRDVTYKYPDLFHLEGIKIFSPSGFEDKVLAEVPMLSASLGVRDFLLKKTVRFERVQVVVSALHLEKSSSGHFNLWVPGSFQRFRGISIGELSICFHRITYWDRSKPAFAKVSEDLRVNNKMFYRLQGIEEPWEFVRDQVAAQPSLSEAVPVFNGNS